MSSSGTTYGSDGEGGNGAIFSFFIGEPGLYEVCVDPPLGSWVLEENSSCDPAAFFGTCNSGCAPIDLFGDTAIIYWDPQVPGECNVVDVTVRFIDAMPPT